MIPTFLKELAALIRHRIAVGQAVHVTEQTAKEMELLAGLPWDRAYPDLPPAAGWNRLPTPADIALGWLLASKALGWTDGLSGAVDVERAVKCAELAVLARETLVLARCRESAIVIALMGKQEVAESILGTRAGARAAWTFIIDASLPAERAVELAREMGYTSIYPFAEVAQEIGETYRRELEEMR